jgi:hypothetical protein
MLAFMSYLTTTFMIESMASANAMLNWKRSQIIKRSESVTHDDLPQETSDSDSLIPTPSRAIKLVKNVFLIYKKLF